MEETKWQHLQDELIKTKAEKVKWIFAQNFERAAAMRDREKDLMDMLDTQVKEWTIEQQLIELEKRADQWDAIYKEMNEKREQNRI